MIASRDTKPLWVVAADGGPSGGVIGGGSQSARNLLLGLREAGETFTPVALRPGANAASTVAGGEFGPGLSLELPLPHCWADAAAVGLIRRLAAEHRPRLVHLLDPVPHLGSWLEALRDAPIPVAYTALDYNWICTNSQLITRRGELCPGPHSAADCLRCHFDHRTPLGRLGLRAARAVAALPPPLWPRQLAVAALAARRERGFTPTRLAALPADFARLDALIAPSLALADRFAANGFPRRKIFHVPYGTRPGTRALLAQRPPLSDGVIFGYAGRLELDKGADLLLDALHDIRATTTLRPKLAMYAGASDTGFNRATRRRLESPAFRDWTSLGQFDGRDPAALDAVHRAMHFFVAPSRWTDNLPNAVLEALERGTPVLAPDQGSFVEMVEHGRNGWLYPSHPRGGLTRLLHAVAADPKRHWDLPFDLVRTRPPAAEAADVLNVYRTLEGKQNPHP